MKELFPTSDATLGPTHATRKTATEMFRIILKFGVGVGVGFLVFLLPGGVGDDIVGDVIVG